MTTKKTAPKKSSPFTADERAAMQARAGEVRASRGRGTDKAAAEAQAVLDAIAALPPADRKLAEKIHTLVTEAAPELAHKTWYGMPAYFKDGKILCYFKAAEKFKARYAQFGFEDAAQLDDGNLWPTVYAITDLTDADAAVISERVRKAVGSTSTRGLARCRTYKPICVSTTASWATDRRWSGTPAGAATERCGSSVATSTACPATPTC